VPYPFIDVDHTTIIKDDRRSFSFTDNNNIYSFNRSKSVLMMNFKVPQRQFKDIDVNILNNPLTILQEMISAYSNGQRHSPGAEIPLPETRTPVLIKGRDYVILPLFSRKGYPHVPQKSGLNQWNAGGRPRDPNEVYIHIPSNIYNLYPNFFPSRDEHFTLKLPNRRAIIAKVCQDHDNTGQHPEWGKALMSMPNATLGRWILRRVLRKRMGDLVTMDDLNRFGIDSVMITNNHMTDLNGRQVYSISFTSTGYESYADFIGDSN
jgi:hypothetical protein